MQSVRFNKYQTGVITTAMRQTTASATDKRGSSRAFGDRED